MATAKQQNSSRRFPWWMLIGILLIVLLPFLTGNKSIFTLFSLYEENQLLKEQKRELELENQQLVEEIDKLREDLDYIEKMAREQYNLRRSDEDVYDVVPEERDN